MSYNYLDYFSEAYNSSALQSGVSPQTGIFQATLTIASISRGIQEPVDFTLNLAIGIQSAPKSRAESAARQVSAAHQTKSEIDEALLNASLNIPYIDLNRLKIFFSSGKAEELTRSGDTYTMPYHRLDDVKIERILIDFTSTYYYRVAYKGGVVEYYNHYGYLLVRASAAGHVLRFTYDSDYRCTHIGSDGAGEILVAYGENNTLTITKKNPGMSDLVTKVYTTRKYRGTKDEQDQKLYPEDCVESVSLSNDDDHRYRFEYKAPVNNLPEVLYSVTTPYGMRQQAIYTAVKYGKTEDQKDNYIAVVSRLETLNNIPAGEQSEPLARMGYTEYDYISGNPTDSEFHNFTGYEDSDTYRPVSGIDNCIRKKADYTYTVIEKKVDPTKTKTTEVVSRTYNRFHLIEKEVFSFDSKDYYEITRSYKYPITAGVGVEDQPKNFMFWTTCTTTSQLIKDGKKDPKAVRAEVESRKFDNYGNLESSTPTTGITMIHTYYEAVPTEKGCPPAPDGMPLYIKSTSITPNQLATDKPASKVEEFTYLSLTGNMYSVTINPAPDGSGNVFTVTPSMVLLETTTKNGMLMSKKSYEGAKGATPDSLLTGVLIEETSSSGGRTDRTEVTWKFEDNNTKLRQETTFHTNLTTKPETRESRAGGGKITWLGTGQTDTEIAPNASKTKFEYNTKGQLKKRTAFYGTEYAQEETFNFTLWEKLKFGSYYGNTLKYSKQKASSREYALNRDLQVEAVTEPDIPAPNSLFRNRYTADGSLYTHSVFDLSDKSTISKVATHTINPMSVSTLNADGSSPWEAFDPVNRAETKSMALADVIYFSELSVYGSVFRTGYTQTVKSDSGKEEVKKVILRQNIYDGFGRLVRTSGVQMKPNPSGPDIVQEIHPTTFEYDQFDRLKTEKSYESYSDGEDKWTDKLQQTTTYTYSSHIPCMYLPVEVKCVAEESVDPTTTKNIMFATRTYDGFARLTRQETPGDTSTTTVTESYSYARTIDNEPSRVQKNRGSVEHSYNATTELLESTTLVNDTSPAQTAATKSTFEYDKTTRLLKKEAIGLTSDDKLLSQYAYIYNANEQVTLMECSIPEINEVSKGAYVSSYMYTTLQGDMRLADFGVQATAKAIPRSLWKEEYVYNKIGQLVQVCITTNDGDLQIDISLDYLGQSQGYDAGDVDVIYISMFDTKQRFTWLNSSLSFLSNEKGMEKERVYVFSVGAKSESFKVEQDFNSDLKISARNISRRRGSGDKGLYKAVYGYGTSAGAPLKSSIHTANGQEIQNLKYEFNGMSRFYRVDSTAEKIYEKYSYNNDRVTGFRDKYGALQAFTYDRNGNVLTDNQQSTLRYNALNSIGSFDKNTDHGIERTEYFYTPDGKLLKVLDKSTNQSIYYLYEGDAVIGELEAINGVVTARAFYLRVAGIMLGRYITVLAASGEEAKHFLDMYITDAVGSVLGVQRYTQDSMEPPAVQYYTYTDYGERRDGGFTQ
ncbi:hypothetical protein [Pseudomonas chlororaphis]|uniref:hypothetical protein n=1 Tax=Pseudomonas chlororaphis TaxID=587753 RepID=UPI0015DF83C7|nr:hypothetical protein [Pseudomonas chlororaphis]QLL16018.1 hypothetical protein H0I86_13405 [Pseudomonas chlororaphis subsp. aurantiaca]